MFSERKSARDFLFSKRNLWCDITESIEGREATDVSVTIIEEKMNTHEQWERGEKMGEACQRGFSGGRNVWVT